MSNKIGLQVEEGVTKGFSSLVEPSKRNIGVLMARLRGVANLPVLLSSLEEDRSVFGGFLAGAYGYAVIKNMFRNSRGYTPSIYGLRVVGAGSSVAQTTLDVSGLFSLEGTASYMGSEDVGSWGNDLAVILYPKGIKSAGKWYFEVLYKGRVVESYSSALISEIIAQTQESKFAVFTSATDFTVAENSELAKSFDGLISVGLSGLQTANGFLLTTIPVDFVNPVGFVLLDSKGSKIGTVATFNVGTKVGTLVDVALVSGNLNGATFLTDEAYTANFTGGVYVAPVESDFYGRTTETEKMGLDLFKTEDVQIVMNTEFHTNSMAIEGKAFAEDSDVLYVANLPENANLGVAQDFANSLQTGTVSHIAVYHGWAKTIVDDVNSGYVPVIGCVIGAGYVRATGMQGDFIHIPPAGVDSAFSDISEVKGGKLSQVEIDRYVQDFTVNVVKYQIGLGYFLISSRTMSTNALYHSIHIRLQTSFYKRVISENFNWVLQKPNTPELKRSIYSSLFTYFRNEYNNGALENSVPFTTACVIIVDKRNNPVGQDRKLLNTDIDWIPTEATESVRISMNRNDGQLLLNEVTTN
jgi:hypothetical protein